MFVLIIRTLILYGLIILAIRIMGKKQIGELQPSELVVAIMISDLAAVPMQTIDIPLLTGIVPVLTLLVAEVTMSFISLKSKRARKYITGEPSIIIKSGRINEKELEKARFTLNDLMEELRISGYPDVSKIDMAILETNGEMSIIEKSKDSMTDFPYILISDGEMNRAELKRAGKSEEWLKQRIKCDFKDVFIASLNSDNELTVQKKERKK
ncbi:MAG: DUF421 domain-containing protein [Clostridia bacterium]|nr:DUF421 domain-containing protein [Clostridia bacterium]MBQ7751504.1 DUF421 domain-containing protein [Clostridia bacterium]